MIKSYSDKYAFDIDNHDYYNELDLITSNTLDLHNILTIALKNNTFEQFADLKIQILNINASITNSQMYQDYSKYFVRREFIDKRMDPVFKVIDKSVKKDSLSTLKIKLDREYQAKLKDQSARLQSSIFDNKALLEKENSELKAQLEQLLNPLQPSQDEEVKHVPQQNAEDAKIAKRDDDDFYEDQKKDLKILVENYYLSNFNSKVSLDEDFSLYIDMKNNDHRNLLEYLTFKKLPSIKRIHILNVMGENISLRCFLMTSFPESVKFFAFNLDSSSRMKVDFYSSALQKVLPKVTCEIFFNSMMFSAKDVTNIMLASRNTERLILRG